MSSHIASTTVSGNLVANPRVLGRDGQVVSMRLASERYYRKSDHSWEATDRLFIDVVAFGQLADHCARSLRKGMPVIVSGRLLTNEWVKKDEDTGDEVRRSSLRIRAEHIGPDLARVYIKEAVLPLAEGTRTYQLGCIEPTVHGEGEPSDATDGKNSAVAEGFGSLVSDEQSSGDAGTSGGERATRGSVESDVPAASPSDVGWPQSIVAKVKQSA